MKGQGRNRRWGTALVAGALLALAGLAPTAAHAVTFTATNIGVGNAPQGAALGDFNGDARADLAVANEFSDNASVLLGGGDGSFAVASTFSVGNHPTSVVAGDFNGDNDLDLAFTNYNANNVSVFVGGSGSSFSGPTNYAVGMTPTSAAVGNLNGGSDLDLVVTNEGTNDVSVLLGDTGATFSVPTNFAVGSEPQSVAVGKLDGDSTLDLAVANKLTDNVSVLLGGGDGSFGAATNFAGGSQAIGSISVAVDKFNGDSIPDLAVVNELSHNLTVQLGTGGGSFSSAGNFAVGSLPDAVTAGDLNGDSDPDLAVANQASDNISLLMGASGGSFTSPTNLLAGDGPTSVTMGDFNGDSWVDLAVTNEISNTVSILLATPPETTIDSGPPGLSNDPTPTFAFSSNDPSATFKCRIDNGTYFSCASPHTTSLLDGTHTFEVRATNDAGLTDATPASRSFTIDSIPPRSPTPTGTDPGSPANDNGPKIRGTAEAGATVSLYRALTTADCTPENLVATDTAAAFASPGIQASVADNSTTTFRARATDQAGNVSTCSVSSVTYVEVSPPPPPDDPPPPPAGSPPPPALTPTTGGDPLGGFPGGELPPITPVAADKSPPVMAVSARTLTIDSSGAVLLPLSCPASEPLGCQGSVSLETIVQVRADRRRARRTGARKRKIKLGQTSFRIAGGGKAEVKVRLSKSNRRLVGRLKKVLVLVIIGARDQAGNARTTKKTLSLRPAALRSRR